ncbi:MAG: pyruvate, phosphate dikinase, partial [Planctomycetes bacterium]|nr:pyruvate, phosphate dikinase [Planctomycetota bacterium]
MKYIYFFGKNSGKITTVDPYILGNKGGQLANLSKFNLPVPSGFTISTQICNQYLKNNYKHEKSFEKEFDSALAKLEGMTGKRFNDPDNPLLVSVRSGSSVSMPGMMDTILNVGLNDKTVYGIGNKYNNLRFALDCYRRLISMFAGTVFGVDKELFGHLLDSTKKRSKVEFDYQLNVSQLEEIISKFKNIFHEKCKIEFPQDIHKQLVLARNAVFKSWFNTRAVEYRKIYRIPSNSGTACNIQQMVFGNLDQKSGTGVGFTRNVATGKNAIYGEFLLCAQGEDVVAGTRTPLPLTELRQILPKVYNELISITKSLERSFKNVQDFEFTVESGQLYFLQTRNAKRSGIAAIKIAVDMVNEGLITKKDAVKMIDKDHIESVLHPIFDQNIKKKSKAITKGLSASPGAASGVIALTSEKAVQLSKKCGVILVRPETSAEDITGMKASYGILTARGGYTSHAAVVARGMGKPAVVGCNDLSVHNGIATIKNSNKTYELKEGDEISIDGTTGEVYIGRIPTTNILKSKGSNTDLKKYLDTIMSFIDEFRKMTVKANADTPEDLAAAVELGAEGVG